MVKVLKENNNIKRVPLECLNGATLLSVEEADKLLTQEERKCTYNGSACRWWLRTAGSRRHCAVVVDEDGTIYTDGFAVNGDFGVRPALRFRDTNSPDVAVGDTFYFGKHKFKVISPEYALCEDIICTETFSPDMWAVTSTDYRFSTVKNWCIDRWYKKTYLEEKQFAGQKFRPRPDDVVADENDFGF